jgi:hypothetical protein
MFKAPRKQFKADGSPTKWQLRFEARRDSLIALHGQVLPEELEGEAYHPIEDERLWVSDYWAGCESCGRVIEPGQKIALGPRIPGLSAVARHVICPPPIEAYRRRAAMGPDLHETRIPVELPSSVQEAVEAAERCGEPALADYLRKVFEKTPHEAARAAAEARAQAEQARALEVEQLRVRNARLEAQLRERVQAGEVSLHDRNLAELEAALDGKLVWIEERRQLRKKG